MQLDCGWWGQKERGSAPRNKICSQFGYENEGYTILFFFDWGVMQFFYFFLKRIAAFLWSTSSSQWFFFCRYCSCIVTNWSFLWFSCDDSHLFFLLRIGNCWLVFDAHFIQFFLPIRFRMFGRRVFLFFLFFNKKQIPSALFLMNGWSIFFFFWWPTFSPLCTTLDRKIVEKIKRWNFGGEESRRQRRNACSGTRKSNFFGFSIIIINFLHWPVYVLVALVSISDHIEYIFHAFSAEFPSRERCYLHHKLDRSVWCAWKKEQIYS